MKLHFVTTVMLALTAVTLQNSFGTKKPKAAHACRRLEDAVWLGRSEATRCFWDQVLFLNEWTRASHTRRSFRESQIHLMGISRSTRRSRIHTLVVNFLNVLGDSSF